MRLNKMGSPAPARSAASQGGAPAANPATPGLDIRESFVQSDQVDDREAGGGGREKSPGELMFPGIAEGLTPAYLEPGWAFSEAPMEPVAQLIPPLLSIRQVWEFSETVHLKNRLLERAGSAQPTLSALLNAVVEDEELLGHFVPRLDAEQRAALLSSLSESLELDIAESDLWRDGFYDQVEAYSRGVFSHRYALHLVDQTRAVFANYFPEVFLDLPVLVKVTEGKINNAGHEWVAGKHRISLEVKEPFGERRHDIADLVSTGSFGEGYQFRRGVSDLVSFVHEYGHAVYDRTLGVPASNKVDRASRALSEGFSVLLELLAIDCLQEELPPMDCRDLLERRRQRVTWLQGALEGEVDPAHMAYAEGTELMVNLFRETGLSGVAEFLRCIEPMRADALPRSDARYKEAIADPELMLDLVGS